jgi:transposase-like protein
MSQFKNLQQLLDFFKDEDTCRQYLEQQRWGGNVSCPFCGCVGAYRTNRGFKCKEKTCHKKFSVTVGTIYENSKISLRVWFAAVYLGTAHKKGISSCQLARDLGITQKTAWFVLHRVREMLREKSPRMLKNVVEVDETYVGGNAKNKHKGKRGVKQGTGYTFKTPVFGLLERDGNMVLKVMVNPDGATLKPIIREVVDKSATIITDGFAAYRGLSLEFKQHEVVNHQHDEYVRGQFHTNSIESFFAILKRGIIGIYHHVSPKHLHRYCDEFSARFNSRQIKDYERFEVSIQNSEGRLKYNDLIKNPA